VDTSTRDEDVAMTKRKKFTTEFRTQAVKMAREAESQTEVARELGMPLTTLNRWVKDAEHKEVPKLNAEQTEVERLRRELEAVKMERDFLKKAAAFFAKHQA
jgi:transposase